MNKIANKPLSDITLASAMLKQVSGDQFKKVIASMILKASRLNADPDPEPELLQLLTNEVYILLANSWPGCKPKQLWATMKSGMTNSGPYRVRVNYPTLANWIMNHRQLAVSNNEKVPDETHAPNMEAQVSIMMGGLLEYRKRVESGEYKPRGRDSNGTSD